VCSWQDSLWLGFVCLRGEAWQQNNSRSIKRRSQRVGEIHADLPCFDRLRIVNRFDSSGEKRAQSVTPSLHPSACLVYPFFFSYISLNKYVDANLLSVKHYVNERNDMANNLDTGKKIMGVAMLAEGNSIASIERMTGIHRDTVMRLGVRVGEACANITVTKMRNLRALTSRLMRFGVHRRKASQCRRAALRRCMTFIALDRHEADSRVIVGKRDSYHAKAFISDLPNAS